MAFLVAEKSIALVGECVDEDVRPTIVVIIGEVNAHAGECLAVVVICKAGSECYFGEGAVVVVTK